MRLKATCAKYVREYVADENRFLRSERLRLLQTEIGQRRSKVNTARLSANGFHERDKPLPKMSVDALALAIADCPTLRELLKTKVVPPPTSKQLDAPRARFKGLPQSAKLPRPVKAGIVAMVKAAVTP
ncbi:MAG: hypothetical protein U0638_13745 [Phycisphaerales bacterium]